jgi:hypothetical protein
MYVRCVFVQYAAVCHYRRFVCVCVCLELLSGWDLVVDQILPGQQLQITAYEPPEDGGKYGPKHVEATSLKCF